MAKKVRCTFSITAEIGKKSILEVWFYVHVYVIDEYRIISLHIELYVLEQLTYVA